MVLPGGGRVVRARRISHHFMIYSSLQLVSAASISATLMGHLALRLAGLSVLKMPGVPCFSGYTKVFQLPSRAG